jgi:phosphate uptake regulator
VVALDGDFYPQKLIRGVEHMAELVSAQLKQVLDAYASRDLQPRSRSGTATKKSTRCARRCSASSSPT